MPKTVLILNNPILRVAEDAASLASGLAVECQVTQALVQSVPKYNTVPATGCSGESQSPGLSGWQLQLTWLQDWQAGEATSLSWFAFDHDGQQIAFELIPDATDVTTKLTGDAYAVSGAFGGAFGDGSAAQSDQQTWPLLSKPTIAIPATVTAAA